MHLGSLPVADHTAANLSRSYLHTFIHYIRQRTEGKQRWRIYTTYIYVSVGSK